jgi:hypothetical protein
MCGALFDNRLFGRFLLEKHGELEYNKTDDYAGDHYLSGIDFRNLSPINNDAKQACTGSFCLLKMLYLCAR